MAMVVVFLAAVPGTVWWQGMDGPLRDMVLAYTFVICPSLILVPVYSTVMTTMRSVGLEARVALVSAVILGLNATLTPLLVLGWGPVEGMGIAVCRLGNDLRAGRGAGWLSDPAGAPARRCKSLVKVRPAGTQAFTKSW